MSQKERDKGTHAQPQWKGENDLKMPPCCQFEEDDLRIPLCYQLLEQMYLNEKENSKALIITSDSIDPSNKNL